MVESKPAVNRAHLNFCAAYGFSHRVPLTLRLLPTAIELTSWFYSFFGVRRLDLQVLATV